MALVHGLGQRIGNPGANPGHRRLFNAELYGDGVGSLEGVQLLRAKGSPVGMIPGMAFARESTTVLDGSRLYMFSDGAFEIQQPDGRIMKLDDLVQFIRRPVTGEKCDLDLLFQYLLQLRGGEALEDDFSIVRFRFSYRLHSGLNRYFSS